MMMNTHLKNFAPGRLFLPGCAVAAGLLAVAPARADVPANAPVLKESGARLRLAPGKTAYLPLPTGATFQVESGANLVETTSGGGSLAVRALGSGDVRLRFDFEGRRSQTINLRIEAAPFSSDQFVERRANLQVVEAAGATAPAAAVAPTLGAAAPGAVATAPGVTTAYPVSPTNPVAPLPALVPNTGTRGVMVPASPATAPRLSPVMPPPSRTARAQVTYNTTSRMPATVSAAGARQSVPVTQGLARLLSFPTNILAVFFSDPNVMDARAINARTIAVTGVGSGSSTLAVFTARYDGDAVGQASIYRVEVQPKASNEPIGPVVDARDPLDVQSAIESAIGDPRVKVAVYHLPDSTLAARLSGTVRSTSEVSSATATASFFVSKVISSVYADPTAPTIEAVNATNHPSMGGNDADLQANLRRVTGNDTIELTSLPDGSLILKAEANSQDEADIIMRLVPSLNREVVPMIVVHGMDNSRNPLYGPIIPNLAGEDRQLTQKLQSVTGVRTVYAVRTASNSLAVYGVVAGRADYNAVRRMAQNMAQITTGAGGLQGTSAAPTGIEARSASVSPATGYQYPNGVQIFVRILDPHQASIRQVTVQTNVVEINRKALKNLGVQYGTAQLNITNVTPSIPPSLVSQTTTPNPLGGAPTVTSTFSAGTPGSISGTQATQLTEGSYVAGNGFLGSGGFSLQDAFRTKLDALYSDGNAHILSSPNVTATEGNLAQIIIGGSRPIPEAVASNGAVGTSFVFRAFGVILNMRPTVTDDDTIILQIKAQVTQPDFTTAVTVNGATVPGETVRSVDTVLTVKAGDIIVLGGLVTNEHSVQTSRVPVLSNLPILGKLFQSKSFQDNKSELAIFMTPTLNFIPASAGSLADANASPSFPVLPSVTEALTTPKTSGG